MNRKAFTLLEILIVVLILGILISIAVPTIKGAVIKARLAQIFPDVSQLERALDYLYAEGTLQSSHAWDDIAAFGEAHGVDVPEENGYFDYEINFGWYYSVKVRTKPPLEDKTLCIRYIYIIDHDTHEKGERFWVIYTYNEWFKYLKALLPDAEVA